MYIQFFLNILGIINNAKNDLWERSLDALFYEIKACLIKTKHSYLSFCIKYMTNSTFYFHFMRKWTRYAPKCRCFVVEVTVVPLIEDLLNSTVRENCVGHLLF